MAVVLQHACELVGWCRAERDRYGGTNVPSAAELAGAYSRDPDPKEA